MELFEAHPRVRFKILTYLIVSLFLLGRDLGFKFKMKLHFMVNQSVVQGRK